MTDITRAAKRSHNMGRPLGSRDKFPRVAKGTRDAVLRGGVEERARMLETENGHLRRRLADLEAEKAAAGWPGDATGMLVATYKGEYHPTPPQLYAAKIVYDRELDRNRAELDAQRRALDERDRAGDATLEKLIAQFAEFTADRSAELDALVAAGDVTPSGAETIRSWFIRDEPVALPAPVETPVERVTEKPGYQPEPEPIEPTQVVRVVFAPRPFWIGQVGPGRKYDANSACEIEVDDPDDRRDLLQMGCREHR